MATGQKLSNEEVRAIAELAKLAMTDDEVAMYAEQLSEILDYFQLLQSVDTSGVDAMASVLPHRNVLREDAAPQALNPQDAIANAPSAEAQQFKVSAVLGDE